MRNPFPNTIEEMLVVHGAKADGQQPGVSGWTIPWSHQFLVVAIPQQFKLLIS